MRVRWMVGAVLVLAVALLVVVSTHRVGGRDAASTDAASAEEPAAGASSGASTGRAQPPVVGALRVTLKGDGSESSPAAVRIRCGAPSGWVMELDGEIGTSVDVRDVPVGTVDVGARAEGFVIARARAEVSATGVSEVTLTLVKLCEVRVTVSSESGAVPGAVVELGPCPQAERPPMPGGVRRAGQETAGDGCAVFRDVAPGQYVVSVHHSEYAGVEGRSISVHTGEPGELRIAPSRGVRLAGRATLPDGQPFTGVRVHVLYADLDERGGGTFLRAGWAETDSEGRFLTPAAPIAANYKLRLAAFRGGILQTAQATLERLGPGTHEIGEIGVLRTRVRFRMEGGTPTTEARVFGTVHVPATTPAVLVDFRDVPVNGDGVAEIVGLPAGEVTWDLLERAAGGGDVCVGSGTDRIEGADCTIVVRRDVRPELATCGVPALRLPAERTAEMYVYVESDGGLVWAANVQPTDPGELRPRALAAGTYRVVAMSGDRVVVRELTLPFAHHGTSELDLTPCDVGRSLTISVREGGSPRAGVEVSLSGFGRRAPGAALPLGSTGVDGTLVVPGLPSDTRLVRVRLTLNGRGRQFAMDLEESDRLEVDWRDL